jgi:hypothetical protein
MMTEESLALTKFREMTPNAGKREILRRADVLIQAQNGRNDRQKAAINRLLERWHLLEHFLGGMLDELESDVATAVVRGIMEEMKRLESNDIADVLTDGS